MRCKAKWRNTCANAILVYEPATTNGGTIGKRKPPRRAKNKGMAGKVFHATTASLRSQSSSSSPFQSQSQSTALNARAGTCTTTITGRIRTCHTTRRTSRTKGGTMGSESHRVARHQGYGLVKCTRHRFIVTTQSSRPPHPHTQHNQ